MRKDTVTTKVYSFDELSDEAKETAIANHANANVECDWWDSTYEDAKTIGLTIEEFDLDRGAYVKGNFIDSAEDAARLIVENHGDSETVMDATQYQADRNALVAKYSSVQYPDRVHEDYEYDFDADCDELDEKFLRTICEDYSILLQGESEYLQSEEAIIETIEANEYEFTEDGNLY